MRMRHHSRSARATAKHASREAGFMMPTVLSIIIAISILSSALLMVILTNFTTVGNNVKSQQAFNIAEAGINYYLWHLSHNPTDYKDGQSTPATPDVTLGYGPYVHNYVDDDAVVRGTFTLWIKPQGEGSTIVTVRAIGKVNGTNINRTIDAQIGMPSFAKYGLVSNGALNVGATSIIDGPLHSNVGIRMDGTNTGDVTSSNATYVPPSNLGGNGSTSHPGVWCGGGTDCAGRTATNNNGTWRYPVPSVDFGAVTGDMCSIKKTAFAANTSTASLANLSNACSQVPTTRTNTYIPRYQSTFSAQRGYLIELNTDGTYNLYGVAGETYNYTSDSNYTYQYTAALNETLIASNIALHSSGIIFVEDNVWVRTNPTFHGRVTIAAARLASTTDRADVYIADDLKYSTKNGQDAIGLIAEDSVIVAPYAPPRPSDSASNYPFEINAAVIAKEGNMGFTATYGSSSRDVPFWDDSTKPLLFYGSISVLNLAVWQYHSSSDDDGFGYRTTQYDDNLLYAPPPNYPTTGSYDILSWREVLTKP